MFDTTVKTLHCRGIERPKGQKVKFNLGQKFTRSGVIVGVENGRWIVEEHASHCRLHLLEIHIVTPPRANTDKKDKGL